MTIYYLMVKTHKITGLKYLCQTKRKDPYKYLGSGIAWTTHLTLYGKNIDTEVLAESVDKQLINDLGRACSSLWRVVTSTDDFGNKIWANIIPETGGGPGGKSGPNGRTPWNKGLTKNTDSRVAEYSKSLSDTIHRNNRPAHNKGKTGGTNSQKGIPKPYQCGDNNPARRPESRAKIKTALTGRKQSPEHAAACAASRTGENHWKRKKARQLPGLFR